MLKHLMSMWKTLKQYLDTFYCGPQMLQLLCRELFGMKNEALESLTLEQRSQGKVT